MELASQDKPAFLTAGSSSFGSPAGAQGLLIGNKNGPQDSRMKFRHAHTTKIIGILFASPYARHYWICLAEKMHLQESGWSHDSNYRPCFARPFSNPLLFINMRVNGSNSLFYLCYLFFFSKHRLESYILRIWNAFIYFLRINIIENMFCFSFRLYYTVML